jgi:hypothetical protein
VFIATVPDVLVVVARINMPLFVPLTTAVTFVSAAGSPVPLLIVTVLGIVPTVPLFNK